MIASSQGSLVWALLLATTISGVGASEFQFTDEILRLTVTAVRLSLVSYTNNKTVLADYALQMYRDNPDQAAVTQIDGVCFAAFRGTVFFNWKDLTQNFKIGNVEVCANGACCDVEKGFYDGYHTNYSERLEENVRRCTSVVTVDSVLSYSRDTRKGKWPILIFRTKVLTVVLRPP